jgi:secreted trypsin-like serine protease
MLVACAGALAIPAPRSGAVINGTVADAQTVPYTVALLYANRPNPFYAQFCAGVYVDAYWVLTAAHCVVGIPASNIQLASGITKLTDITSADRRNVVSKVIDPQFVAPPVGGELAPYHDLALLRLARPVPGAWTIPMNTDPSMPAVNAPLTLYGWGLTDAGYPDSLQQGNLTDHTGPSGPTCGLWFSDEFDVHANVCASGQVPGRVEPVVACIGDSGGPLVETTATGPQLVGVVHMGDAACSFPSFPGVYTRVSTYAPWIQSVIDSTPHVAITDAHVVEGNPATGNKTMHFAVKLDHTTEFAVHVDYATADGTAHEGTDYKKASGTLTIPAGTLSGTIDVVIISDRVREPLESFSVTLSNARIARLGRATASGWITDND